MTDLQFPASYVNTGVEHALVNLAAAPGEATLAALLDAARRGALVVDVTGSDPESPHVRTIASTDGRPVLPLFTSIEQLELAVGQATEGTAVQAAIVPARQALELIESDDFIAVQFNPGPSAQVIARSHVEVALHDGTDS
jgi:hypothetical protein